MNSPFFELTHTDKNSRARAGIMHTAHGDIHTPVFMPVGTQASVKTLDQRDLTELGAEIILGNTYHLHLRPGEDLIAAQGGLHQFMHWNRPILTDSGGFQVFSLSKSKKHKSNQNIPPTPLKGGGQQSPFEGGSRGMSQKNPDSNNSQARLVSIDNDGVTFTSHIDGSAHRFTPEISIATQHQLGADIIMAFDECTPDNATYEYAKQALIRTHAWAKRSLAQHHHTRLSPPYEGGAQGGQHRQFLFGIIQGALHRDLREESAKFISSLNFDGIAIGGESIGYNMEATAKILDWVYPLIPKDKPHYTMGIGLSPLDLLLAIEHGADMFDCVAPTRLARHGMVYVHPQTTAALPNLPLERGGGLTPPSAREGVRGSGSNRLNLKNSCCKSDTRPIDEHCACSTCRDYTRSYLHHLFSADEMTGLRLATIHNLHFMLALMRETRKAILEDRFVELKKQWS